MSTTAIETVIRMMESLPDEVQDRAVEHLREYLDELMEEIQWDRSFERTRPQLTAAARKAKQEKAAGLAEPFDTNDL